MFWRMLRFLALTGIWTLDRPARGVIAIPTTYSAFHSNNLPFNFRSIYASFIYRTVTLLISKSQCLLVSWIMPKLCPIPHLHISYPWWFLVEILMNQYYLTAWIGVQNLCLSELNTTWGVQVLRYPNFFSREWKQIETWKLLEETRLGYCHKSRAARA